MREEFIERLPAQVRVIIRHRVIVNKEMDLWTIKLQPNVHQPAANRAPQAPEQALPAQEQAQPAQEQAQPAQRPPQAPERPRQVSRSPGKKELY